MAFPNEHLSYYLDCAGMLLCGYPLPEYEETFCRSLRFGTFGPPSNEPKAYLMSTLGMVETGETYQNTRFAASNRLPMSEREDRQFFSVCESGADGLILGGRSALGYVIYPNEKTSEGEGVFVCWDQSGKAEECRALGRAALDRYLAFLFLHQESDAWSHGEAFGLWLGRMLGRADMRERAAKAAEDEAAEDEENGREEPPEFPYLRRDIAERIRALEVWR